MDDQFDFMMVVKIFHINIILPKCLFILKLQVWFAGILWTARFRRTETRNVHAGLRAFSQAEQHSRGLWLDGMRASLEVVWPMLLSSAVINLHWDPEQVTWACELHLSRRSKQNNVSHMFILRLNEVLVFPLTHIFLVCFLIDGHLGCFQLLVLIVLQWKSFFVQF